MTQKSTVGPRNHRRANHAIRARIVPRLEALEDRMLLSTLMVLNVADSGTGSLRDTIAAANSGDKIVFDSSLQGQTIKLTSGELAINKSLDIEGLGADKLTVSGNSASRVFDLTGSGANVTIAGLTIANGLAAQGGGIDNGASNLTLSKDVLSNDQAVGLPGGSGEGGGVYNGSAATLHVTDSVFKGDVVKGGAAAGANGDAGAAFGGGLYNAGVATITGSTLTANQAHGGDGGPHGVGGNGVGAGIWNEGNLDVSHSRFTDNQSLGGRLGDAGSANFPFLRGNGAGAGIYNVANLTVNHTIFANNQVFGGAGDAGISGGAGNGAAILTSAEKGAPVANATISDSTFADNHAFGGAGGDRAAGGSASGGAILNDNCTLTLRHTDFSDNQASGGTGGVGGAGGPGTGGAIRNVDNFGDAILIVSHSAFRDNQAVGGSGGAGGVGGVGIGGGISTIDRPTGFISRVTVIHSTLSGNEAVGGDGTTGGAALGGALANQGGSTLTVIDGLLFDNEAQGGNGSAGNGGNALGGGIFTDAHSTLTLTGSRITRNEADGGTGAAGFSDGNGQGGGVYVATGGSACEDDATVIAQNLASTSNDDVFGVLSNC